MVVNSYLSAIVTKPSLILVVANTSTLDMNLEVSHYLVQEKVGINY